MVPMVSCLVSDVGSEGDSAGDDEGEGVENNRFGHYSTCSTTIEDSLFSSSIVKSSLTIGLVVTLLKLSATIRKS